MGIFAPDRRIVTRQVIDSTDITLNDIAGGYNNFGAAFNVVIPVAGVVRAILAARLSNDAAANGQVFIGIRIGAVNYWFGEYQRVVAGVGPTVGQQNALGVTGAAINDFHEPKGFAAGQITGGVELGLNIAAAGIPAGSQSVQVVVARSASAACSLRGTATNSRALIEISGVT